MRWARSRKAGETSAGVRRVRLLLASRLRIGVPLVLLDAMLVAGSYVSLLAIRFDGRIPDGYSNGMFRCLPIVIGVHVLANLLWGLYGQIWRHASIAEARRIVLAGVAAGVVIFPVDPLDVFDVPRSVAVLAAVVATMFMGLVRFQARLFSFRRKIDLTATPVVVIGAGHAGASIIRDMQRSPESGRQPVAVVDDDGRTHGRALLGVPVVGAVADLPSVVARFRAREALMADPAAHRDDVRAAMEAAECAAVPIKVVPPVRELLAGAPSVRDVRDLRIDDLLGRRQVITDGIAIAATLGGRRVLITGAGGSIGSEIAVQVASYAPSLVVLLDHDETHLHDVAARLPLGVAHQLVLTDIRDRDRLESVFRRCRPEVVFHAAAHKHVPLLEADPVEAVHTNVVGTHNVLAAAAEVAVDRLVFISSDKAVRPVNVLGRSKYLGEQLVLAGTPPGSRWCSVRFGNVIGSRGSVIPTFTAQIRSGGPVTVTDERMTRYFMSVQEAVTLALQAAAFAEGGELFTLNVGEPVNVLALARRMIRLSGKVVDDEIAVEFVGVRPGEKLVEQLSTADEEASPTRHDAITRLSPIPLGADRLATVVEGLRAAAAGGDDEQVRRVFDSLAGEPVVAASPVARPLIGSTSAPEH